MATERPTQKEKQNSPAVDPKGLNADGNAGTGNTKAELEEINEGRLDKSLPITSKILISTTGTGYYIPVSVPHNLAHALKIQTDADLTAANTRVAVADTAKVYVPRINKATEEGDEGSTPTNTSNKANTKNMDETRIKNKQIVGKRFIVRVKSPVDQTVKGVKKTGYIKKIGMRVPDAVSIAAFGTWLSKFADPTEIPLLYWVEKSSIARPPGDYTDNLTKIDISGP
ncbi:hypothetical protein [Okeania sp. SIO2B3]|uniref:hypothetical protein n=1 Tax=Okeania sp. SIO2B3 TaxID=2607784 RepID=UPI0013C06ADB|nr:hypothetical protein [Okeania sp. SIO2B3]NET40616.1 hypothetical protein [Okeania sp. SIO2B3]